jgi:hypothetical protein
LAEERDEGLLEVEARRAHGLLELARRAGEQELPVGEHEHAVRVSLGLLHVVRRVDHRGALRLQREQELPQALALARVERGARLTVTMRAPRRFAVSSEVSMRGWFVPGFWPTMRIRSAAWTSSSDTLPLPTPSVSVSA